MSKLNRELTLEWLKSKLKNVEMLKDFTIGTLEIKYINKQVQNWNFLRSKYSLWFKTMQFFIWEENVRAPSAILAEFILCGNDDGKKLVLKRL